MINSNISDSIPYTISSSNVSSSKIATDALTIKGTGIEDMIEAKIKALEKNTRFTFTELSCRNCGGKIHQKIDDYIVKCPYCETAYLIGREQIYSR